MNYRCAIAVIVMTCSAHIAPANVQAQQEILTTAAQYVQRAVPKQHLSVDPKIYTAPRYGPPPIVSTLGTAVKHPVQAAIEVEYHPDSGLAELLGDSLITVMSRERALACRGPWKPECKTNGPESFVSLSRPVVRGDSAFIDAVVWVLNTPTAADTAGVLANPPPRGTDAVLSRLRLGGGHLARMILLRSNNVWRIVEYRMIFQT